MTLKNRIVDISYLKKIKEEIEKFADNYIDEKVRNLLKNIN